MKSGISDLFVYGSLLSGFNHPAHLFVSRYFTLTGQGRVQGKLYDLDEYPGAVPAGENFFIEGELYHVNHADEFSYAIRQLDDYEGLLVEAPETPLFRREAAAVLCNGVSTMAWIYWYNLPVEGRPLIPAGELLSYWKSKA
ncbi:MAG: gamma-glutamylcyclotransferase [Candidatus Pseudobacter hemicellulosilyticus]|uniref:Gamma-glutamylcyclotransferase n=1 Tax=Candidatus Pseudobacter hemicellulosilyticus TaxID=3121375 RepID=A0AAJ5WVB4_9BACT|nr:MAG: gamma-glutamylcyclotransferase [Pseudobacter sp.]